MDSGAYHYPPELLNLLIDVIPRINRSKEDVFIFFRGAGVSESILAGPWTEFKKNRDSINKYQITRQIITKLNDLGERCLRERRIIIRRVVEFESFETCWDNDRKEAMGLVAEVRRVTNTKDSFTRMQQAEEKERNKRMHEKEEEAKKKQQMAQNLDTIKQDFYKLFSEINPHKRGKALESILNRLFGVYSIYVKNSFHLNGDNKEGIIEQIDGAFELDGHLYLVEMKWWETPLGVGEISEHLVRLFSRGEARGMILSNSGFSEPAVVKCKEALQKKTIVLCGLDELVYMLERQNNFNELIREKTRAAITDQNPFKRIFGF